jgi:hypothetical protein
VQHSTPQCCNSSEATFIDRAPLCDKPSIQQHRDSSESNDYSSSNYSNSHCLIGMAMSERGSQGPVVVADTGCNLVIVNRHTIGSLNLITEPACPHFYVQFGDSTRGRVKVTEVVEGGKLLGKMAVVDGAVENLGGIIMFTSRGCAVTFTEGCVVVTDQQGRQVVSGTFDSVKRLYLFDLREMLRISKDFEQLPLCDDMHPLALRALTVLHKRDMCNTTDDDTEENQQQQQQQEQQQQLPRVQGAQPSIGRLTTAQIRLGRDVHSVSGHIAPSTLANSLQDGVLDGVPNGLTPTLIRGIPLEEG